MSAAKEQLGHLLVLVAERQWTPLAIALADLLLAWPPDYPERMHAPMQALFETAVRQADPATVTALAPRFTGRPELPVKMLNAFYLSAPPAMRHELLARNEAELDEAKIRPADGALILAAARNGARDFAAVLAAGAAIPRKVATAVLSDGSGEALAVLCRGSALDRACFSAIALLKGPRAMPLSAFDTVSVKAAAHIVADWRKAPLLPDHLPAQAAE